MSLRHIGAWLLRRWPLVGGALLIAATAATLAVVFSESRETSAQPAPTDGIQKPIYTEWQLDNDLPTTEELKALGVQFREVDVTEEGGTKSARSVSSAEEEYIRSDPTRTMYIRSIDKVYHLPDDVQLEGPVMLTCPHRIGTRCPSSPVYNLLKGEHFAQVDSEGYYFVRRGTAEPEQFSFLSKAGFKKVEYTY